MGQGCGCGSGRAEQLDSLDMLADAGVYALALMAVGRSLRRQRRAAAMGGLLQIALAALVFTDGLRRYLIGGEPSSGLMVGIGLLALAANLLCLALVRRHRDGGVHMRASVIFSTNDTMANAGVINAGLLVLRGGLRILQETLRDISDAGAAGAETTRAG